MYRDTSSRLLFVLLLLAVAWAALGILAPFIAGLTWAAVLVVTFRPFHRRLRASFGGRDWPATAIVTLLVAAFVIVPVTMAAVKAFQGAVAGFEWAQQIRDGGATPSSLAADHPWIADLVEQGKRGLGLAHVDLRAVAIRALQGLAAFLAAAGPALVGGALGLAFSFIVMIIGIPLLFSHGEGLRDSVASALPMPIADAERILQDIGDMTRSVFISVGLTAAVQAALGVIGFAVLGVPRPGTLGAVMFFLALIPGGVALVWVPVAIWLGVNGHTWSAILMAVWGGGVIGTSDNILRPLLAGRGVKLGGVVLFLGMAGGMISLGIVGLFLGPMILYSLQELVAILRRDVYGHAEAGRQDARATASAAHDASAATL
jgi:predicted PurR-regulated permease PerM